MPTRYAYKTMSTGRNSLDRIQSNKAEIRDQLTEVEQLKINKT